MSFKEIKTGDLDRLITIQVATTSNDEFNAPIKTWSQYIKPWAKVTEVSDREKVHSEEVGSSITTRFVIRHSTQSKVVDTVHRILYDGRIYDIVGVKDIQRNYFIEITAAARSER